MQESKPSEDRMAMVDGNVKDSQGYDEYEGLNTQPHWTLPLHSPNTSSYLGEEVGTEFEHSAISPGGANWIVCVGRCEMVSVWGWV